MLIGFKRIHLLQEPNRHSLIMQENSLGVLTSGYEPDCEYVKREVSLLVQSHKLKFAETIPLASLAIKLAMKMSACMYDDGEDTIARPLAVNTLISQNINGDIPKILLVECSGSVRDCKFVTVGKIPASLIDDIKTIVLSQGINLTTKLSRIFEIMKTDLCMDESRVVSAEYLICDAAGVFTREELRISESNNQS